MRKRLLIVFIGVIFIFCGACLAVSGIEKKKNDELYRQVEVFSDTIAIIQSAYVEEVKPKELIYGALKGMLASLDAHSQFMDPDAYEELKADTEGKFGGLGIEITIKDGLLTVITPIEDTPAWKAGLKPADRIIKINDELTREMTLSDAVKKMRGKTGETVKLSILRESQKKLLEFKIARQVIKIRDIKQASILQDGIGYIRISEFSENTPRDFDSALDKLLKQNMNSLILDLRNNPGGLLDSAVKVSERFIPAGKLIISASGRDKSQKFEVKSEAKKPIVALPLAVIINEGSASGSEIVAACLQDYKRAAILGKKSFGKGSIQTVIPLFDGSALRLTTGRYLTPSGKLIHGKGVTPDILVEDSAVDGQKTAPEDKEPDKDLKSPEFDYKSDPQIIHALEALKAAKLYKDLKND